MGDYETKISALEKIVIELEKGEISLDDSLKLFAKGIGLVDDCNKYLEEAEMKIKNLLGDSLEKYEEYFIVDSTGEK